LPAVFSDLCIVITIRTHNQSIRIGVDWALSKAEWKALDSPENTTKLVLHIYHSETIERI
jgi:hypothetical protein